MLSFFLILFSVWDVCRKLHSNTIWSQNKAARTNEKKAITRDRIIAAKPNITKYKNHICVDIQEN